VDVCPNRANYFVDGLEKTVIHLDGPCNDCGNCASLCPFGFKPYADKFVLYPDRSTLEESTRDGFAITEGGYVVRYQGEMVSDPAALPLEVTQLMDAVKEMNLAQ
jgi:putative selenate reductase